MGVWLRIWLEHIQIEARAYIPDDMVGAFESARRKLERRGYKIEELTAEFEVELVEVMLFDALGGRQLLDLAAEDCVKRIIRLVLENRPGPPLSPAYVEG